MEIETLRPYSVIITTDVGRATFKLFPEEAPRAVNSFVFLANAGFYDGVRVHRVLPGILAETGDPTGTGDGGPGYTFEIEPTHRPYVRGDLVMANAGTPNSNGSRFFIILDDVSANGDLSPDYTLLGRIKEKHGPSEATLDKLGAVPVGPGPDGEVSVPQEEIRIVSVTVTVGCLPSQGMFTGCGGRTGN